MLAGFLKKYWPIILISVISGVIYHTWLSFGVFSHDDWNFYFSEAHKNYTNPAIWDSLSELGKVNVVFYMMPVYVLLGIFSALGYDYNVAEKFLYFWPFIFVTGIGSFYLAKYILKNNFAALAASFIYSYNVYFLSINTQGHFSLTVASTFVPLVVLFFIRSMAESKTSFAVLSALFLSIVGSYDFRVLYITAIIISLFFAYHIIFKKSGQIKTLKKDCQSFFIFIFVTISLDIFWILPFLKMGSLTQNEALSRKMVDFSLDIQKTMALFHPFWNGGDPVWFDTQKMPFYFWLIPILAFSGLWLNRKNKKILFFGLVSLVGIFFSKQNADPFGGFYVWLYDHLPGFNAFREASKFYIAIILGYSILIGSLIKFFLERPVKNKTYSYIGYFLFVSVSILFLFNARSVLRGDGGKIYKPIEIQDEAINMRKLINSQPDFFRVLWVPSEPTQVSFSDNHPKVGAVIMKKFNWENFSKNYGQGNDLETPERVIYTMSQPFSDNLIDLSSIKYVIVANERDKYYIDSLEKINYLKKIDAGQKEATIFLNENFRPHIYTTEQKETIHQEMPYKNIEYKAVNPSQYKVSIKNADSPFYLNFSESYHPDWRLRAGDFNWFGAITDKNYFLPVGNHFQNDAELNSFYVNPAEICVKNSCVKNQDGSYNLDLTVYFRPQAYFMLGTVIFIVVLLGSIVYIIYDFKTKRIK